VVSEKTVANFEAFAAESDCAHGAVVKRLGNGGGGKFRSNT
jgi:hypothetical protein